MNQGIRRVIAGVSVLLMLVVGVSAFFVFDLLGRAGRTHVDIVDVVDISEGALDDISEPPDEAEATLGPEATDDPEAETTAGTSPVATRAAVQRVRWSSARRVAVYVVPSIPIAKVEPKDPLVENILVYGVDARSPSQVSSRTDTMMVVSIDRRQGCIKLTSIMRDTQVTIPGRSLPGRINSAYVYGGVGLLVNTINRTFDLDIQKFVMIDLWSSEHVVDMAGGVRIDVRQPELWHLNAQVVDANEIFERVTDPSPTLAASGSQVLNGRQAVAYGRIRKLDSDHQRTARQRTVAKQLLSAFWSAGLDRKIATLQAGFEAINTNMSNADLLSLGVDTVGAMHAVKEYKIPASGFYYTPDGSYELVLYLDRQVADFHRFLWGTPGSPTIEPPTGEATPAPSGTASPEATPTDVEPSPVPTDEPEPTATPTSS